MRKRDRIFVAPLLLSGLLLTTAPGAEFPVLASESETAVETEQFVFDKADLLTAEEEDELNDMANDLAGNFNMNFVILTTDNAEGKEAEAYADDFYMDNGFYDDGKDGGAIYLIDMDNRRVQVETAGDMKSLYITDDRVEGIIDAGYEDVEDGAYATAFEAMLNATADYIENGVVEDKYNYNEDSGIGEYADYDTGKRIRRITLAEFLIALGIALAAGGVAVSCVVGTYYLKWGKYEYPYKDKAKLKIRRKRDDFIGSHVSRRHIERESNSDSGMTTTHDSSGGGNFGGGGRDF